MWFDGKKTRFLSACGRGLALLEQCLSHLAIARAAVTVYGRVHSLRMITQSKKQYIDLLLEIGFLNASHLPAGGKGGGKGKGKGRRGRGGPTGPVGGVYYNVNTGAMAVIKAVICAGLYPNLVKVEPPPPLLRSDGSRRQVRRNILLLPPPFVPRLMVQIPAFLCALGCSTHRCGRRPGRRS